ncbi:MAG: hypothetical protein [Bacteriophage sp.]|nr:MAG: hypothetical protein [Bacteriophage sp.]
MTSNKFIDHENEVTTPPVKTQPKALVMSMLKMGVIKPTIAVYSPEEEFYRPDPRLFTYIMLKRDSENF